MILHMKSKLICTYFYKQWCSKGFWGLGQEVKLGHGASFRDFSLKISKILDPKQI